MNSANAREFKVVTSDTTCLILLQKLDAFEVLQCLYPQTITTPEVLREFGEGLPPLITIQPPLAVDFVYGLAMPVAVSDYRNHC